MKKLALFLCLFQLLFSNDNLDESLKLNPLHEAVRYNDMDSLKELLSKKVDANQEDDFGNTPLHLAVRTGNFDMVKLLLDNYVDTETKNDFGDTALLIAARNQNLKISKELICAGSKYDVADSNNISSLQYAIKNNNQELINILTSKPKDLKCSIVLSVNKIDNSKTNKICGKVLRGKVSQVIFFILDTENKALIESTKAKILDNGRTWCAKSNAYNSLSGKYEIFVNAYGEGKKGKISYKFSK